ncbi:MAG: CotH kinase family protein [Prevotella sp.]|nr:CotH kinase family protein [Prevotella sp.]
MTIIIKTATIIVLLLFYNNNIFANDNNENSLPILYLSGNFGYDYQEGTITLIMPDGTIKENMASKIKWRGGSTNTDDKHKRNYKIKFDTDQQFFGLRIDNKWILDAGQADLFRLRNRIATELWNDIASKPYYADQETDVFTGVRGQVVEVYLNDEYRGIYCLTECMDRKQLKLKKFDKKTGEIHGGLWKSESYGSALMWDCSDTYDNKSDKWDVFEVKYPELGDIDETDYSTLWNAINFVANSTDEDFIKHVAEYFDIPVIIDYYIFLHTLNAFDNVGKNMYWAVYDKAKDKKLTPAVWDLDGTVGAKWLGDWCSPEYDMNINLNLIVRLKQLNVDNFNEKANNRYYELRNNHLSTQNLINRYNSYYELIKNSGVAQREEQKWSKDSDVRGEEINFEKEIEYIKDWITRHMTYLDTNVFPLDTKINNSYDNITDKHIIYNLNGQRIGKPARGIYIQNRRKYIVK